MPISRIQDWGDAFMTSMTAALALFFAAVPRVIAFAVILIIGWLIASLIARALGALFRALKVNQWSERSGLADFVRNMGVTTDTAAFVAGLAKWFIRLIALVVAFDALGLPAVSQVLQQLLLWLPNLVVALAVLVIGGLAARALSRVVRGATAEAGLGNPDLLAKIAAIAVWAFAIVVAVNQVGIASALVNTLFMATVGALALAAGLAFGLGGRDTAAVIVRNWYEKGQRNARKIEAAAEAAGSTARQRAAEAKTGYPAS